MKNRKKENKKMKLNLKDFDLKVQSFVTSVRRQQPAQLEKGLTWTNACWSGGCATSPTCTT